MIIFGHCLFTVSQFAPYQPRIVETIAEVTIEVYGLIQFDSL